MSWAEWGVLDATAMSHLVGSRQVTAKELAEQASEAAALLDPAINAVIEVFDDAVAIPLASGTGEAGPFQGVPILVKDALWGMEGRLQEWGTLLRRGVRAESDDPLVRNMRLAGFNLIGRTALPAFAHADVTESFIHGITRNPWDTAFSPGGSSGGSAAAVAAGIVPIATASDSGGSTRGPATFCGLIGLKGTRGLLPLGAGRSELTTHYYMDGILTRTVRDHAIAYDRMIQRRTGDKSFIPFDRPLESFTERIRTDPPKLRVALSTGAWGFGGPISTSSVDQARKVASALEALGHLVDQVEDSEICDFESVSESALFHFSEGFARAISLVSNETGIPITEETLEPALLHVHRACRGFAISELWHSQELTIRASEQWARFFGRYNLLVSPVEPGLTWPAGTSKASPLIDTSSSPEDLDYVATLMDISRYCWPANDTGVPSIAVPAGLLSNGLPWGALIHSKWGNDGLLMQVAAQLERAKPEWFDLLPPVHAVHL